MLKLATGSVVDSNATFIRRAAGQWQHGVYHQGGTTEMVWDIRQAMVANPDRIFTGVDCRNVFGEALRGPAVRTAGPDCPSFARLLQKLWNDVDTIIHIPEGPGRARPTTIRDGFVQGGCEAAPGFALALAEAVEAFLTEAKAVGMFVKVWAYMDDLYLQCERQHWQSLMISLTTQLVAIGLVCRPDKCNCYIPSETVEYARRAAEEYSEFAQLRATGLPILGTAAEGQYSTTVSARQTATADTEARLKKAEALAEAVCQLCEAPIAAVRRHPSWRILDSVINHCLSYDATVNDPGSMLPYGERLDTLVAAAAARILRVRNWPPMVLNQARLSREHGGCGLRSAAERCYTAYLAAVVRLVAGWTNQAGLDIVGPGVAASLAGLRAMGVQLDRHAMPHTLDTDLAEPFDPATHLTKALPKRQRCWWSSIDLLRHQQLAAVSTEDDRRLHSCSGAEGGAFLRATRADGVKSLADFHFVTATRYRLGMPVMEASSCMHTSHKTGRKCGVRAEPRGHHAVMCKVGGAPYAAHSEGCQTLLQAAVQASYQARREQVIPELATAQCQSPQLDVEGWGLQGQDRLLIDFSIRHPLANRYIGRGKDGTTAVAEGEKAKHYQARSGLQVHAAVMEVYGRHGDGLVSLLELLADHARVRDRSMGVAPGRWLRKWRAQLSSVTAHLVGRAVQQACTVAP